MDVTVLQCTGAYLTGFLRHSPVFWAIPSISKSSIFKNRINSNCIAGAVERHCKVRFSKVLRRTFPAAGRCVLYHETRIRKVDVLHLCNSNDLRTESRNFCILPGISHWFIKKMLIIYSDFCSRFPRYIMEHDFWYALLHFRINFFRINVLCIMCA